MAKQVWTTQVEFWQWVRDCVVVKMQDQSLTGVFRREEEELKILKNHTVLNLGAPNHLREVMLSRHNEKKRRAACWKDDNSEKTQFAGLAEDDVR